MPVAFSILLIGVLILAFGYVLRRWLRETPPQKTLETWKPMPPIKLSSDLSPPYSKPSHDENSRHINTL